MATYTTDQVAQNQSFTPLGGLVGVREATFTVTTALALNDVIQMIPVAEGEAVVGLQMFAADLDTGGSPAIVIAVGDGGNDDRYISGSTVGQAGGVAVFGAGIDTAAEATAAFYRYTATDTIDIKVTTAPATGATGVDITVRALIVGS